MLMKRALTLVAGAALALTLAACGSSSTTATSSTSAAAASTSAAADLRGHDVRGDDLGRRCPPVRCRPAP